MIPNIATGDADNYISTIEVSRHTTESSTVFVGLKKWKGKKITNANQNGGYTIQAVLHRQPGSSVSDIHLGDTEDEIYVTYYNYGINNNIIYTETNLQLLTVSKKEFPDIPVYSVF